MKSWTKKTKIVAASLAVVSLLSTLTFADGDLPENIRALTDYVVNGNVQPARSISSVYTGDLPETSAPYDASQGPIKAETAMYAPSQTMGTRYGMFYFIFHCIVSPQNFDISEALAGRREIGPVPEAHWRAKPDLGYYCPTRDRHVLRRHAEQLRDAGIDFAYVDFTNFTAVGGQGDTGGIEPLRVLMEEWSKVPGAPKIAPYLPLTAGASFPAAVDAILSAHQDMLFVYQGKPLMLVVTHAGMPPDPGMVNTYAQKYTLRMMWALMKDSTSWSFMEPCQSGFKASNGSAPCQQRVAHDSAGQVEQVSVSAAYQFNYMSDTSTAVPKFGGLTFQQQMKRVDEFNPPIVTITGWNEWIAQRFCIAPNFAPDPFCGPGSTDRINGNWVFVDQFDEEYNRDMEPGGASGNKYYELLKNEILTRKRKQSKIIGYIDLVKKIANNAVEIHGWSCTTGHETSVDVHLYVNGPGGIGTMVTSARADQGNEDAIGESCKDNHKGKHRFVIQVSENVAKQHQGKSIYVHGISPIEGNENYLLGNSSGLKMPIIDDSHLVVKNTHPVNTDTSKDATAEMADLHRFMSPTSRHFITASYAEGLGTGWHYEGKAFKMLTTNHAPNGEKVIPIYRCYANGNFISNDPKCEGQAVEGLYGYLWANDGPGRTAVWRLYQHSSGDHLATVNPDEGSGVGYIKEGIIGYTK